MYLIQDPRKLSDTLFNLRGRFSSIDILANPYFQLVKPTPENLKKYRRINQNDKIQFLLTLLSFFTLILQNFTLNFAHCLLYLSESRNLKRQNVTNSEWLIISHFTEAAYQNQHDLVLHTLPEDLSLKQLSNSTFLLNHTKRQYRAICLWLQKTKPNPTILNPRTVSVFAFLTIFFTQTKLALQILWVALNDKGLQSVERTLMIEGAKYQTHRETLVNIMLGKNLTFLARKMDPRNVVFTFEGHAYEFYLKAILQNMCLPQKFYFYQHAPVVPAQFGLINMCLLMTENDQVLASGYCTKDFLQMHLSEATRPALILGSPKYVSISRRPSAGILRNTSKSLILLAPESTEDSLFEFLALGKYLAPRLPQENFAIRFHPGAKITEKDLKSFALNMSTNMHISKRELLDDLILSKICIFRSSAVGVEGLSLGVIPIHLGYLSNSELNPLHLCNSKYTGFTKFEEISAFIQNKEYNLNAEVGTQLQEVNSNNHAYYAEFNSKILFG